MIERLPATLLDGGDARAGAGDPALWGNTTRQHATKFDLVGRTHGLPRRTENRPCDVNRDASSKRPERAVIPDCVTLRVTCERHCCGLHGSFLRLRTLARKTTSSDGAHRRLLTLLTRTAGGGTLCKRHWKRSTRREHSREREGPFQYVGRCLT